MAEEPNKRLNITVFGFAAGLLAILVPLVGGLVWLVTFTANFTASQEGLAAAIEANRVGIFSIRREATGAREKVYEEIQQLKGDLQEENASDRAHFTERMDTYSGILRQRLLAQLSTCEEAQAARVAE